VGGQKKRTEIDYFVSVVNKDKAKYYKVNINKACWMNKKYHFNVRNISTYQRINDFVLKGIYIISN